MTSERTRKRTLVTQELLDSGKDYGWSNGAAAYKYPDGPLLTNQSLGTYQMLLDPPINITDIHIGPTWIDVFDEEPDTGVKVIALCADGLIVPATLVASTGEPYWESDIAHDVPVTHWIPCPEPPKKTEETG